MNRIICILILSVFEVSLAQIQSDRYYKTNLLLERLSVKKFVHYDNFYQPSSLQDLRLRFDELDKKITKLNNQEKDNLSYLKKIYDFHIDESFQQKKELKFLYHDSTLNFIKYQDKNLIFSFNPSATTGFISGFKKNVFYTGWGFYLTGRHKSGLSLNLSFNDNIYRKNYWLKEIGFLDKQGKVLGKNSPNRSEFSDTRGSLSYQNDWFFLGVIKDNIKIGSGESGQLILSNKAPTFSALFYRLDLTDWLKIYTYHGWLMSGIEDSSKSYDTDYNRRIVEHEKYFALHAFQFSPINDVTFTFGETIIYSDRGPYIGYMFPFLFFRSIDHMWTFGSEDSGNNGSFFFYFSANLLKTIKFYSTLFVDELSFKNLLKGNSERNQFGFQVGMKVFDLVRNISRVTLEYTRILPWVYSNWIPAQTYTNLGYLMGHYIGQNSDQIYGKVDYILMPELNFVFDISYTRQGGISDIKNQYMSPGEPFLYGDVRKIFYTGFKIRYEAFLNIVGELDIKYFDVNDASPTRTPDWQRGKNYFVEFRLSYFLENW